MHCRDLKLDNTLLDDSNPPLLKLCDFGFAKTWDAEDANMYTHIGWVTDPVQPAPSVQLSADCMQRCCAESPCMPVVARQPNPFSFGTTHLRRIGRLLSTHKGIRASDECQSGCSPIDLQQEQRQQRSPSCSAACSSVP